MIGISFLLILRRPATAAGVLLCTYALEQWAQSQSVWFFQRQSLTNIVTAGLVVIAVAIRLQKGLPVVHGLSRSFWVTVALLGYMVASVAWSVSPSDTIYQFRSEGLYMLTFALLMPLTIGSRRDLRDAFYALLALGTVLAVLLLTTSRWNSRSIVMETGSLFVVGGLAHGNPLAIGTFGGRLALIALLMNFRGAGRAWQIVRYAVVAIGIFVTIRSGSRGQTVALVVAALALLPYSRRFRDLTGFLGFAISIALFAGLAMVMFDFASRAGGDFRDARWDLSSSLDTIRNTRLGTAQVLLEYWIDGGPLRWLIGIGSSGSYAVPGLNFYCHVVPAEVLGELGMIGLVICLVLVTYVQRDARELWPLVRDEPESRGLVACLLAMLLFEFILSAKEGSLLGSNVLLATAIILGRVRLFTLAEAQATAEQDVGGYEMTEEERLLEDLADDEERAMPQPA